MSMPDTVYLPTKTREWHKGAMHHPRRDGCHCTLGWLWNEFPNRSSMEHQTIRNAILDEMYWNPNCDSTMDDLVSTNDDKNNPRRVLIDVWAGAMRRLGYTEIIDY